jgi:hypothetical protein
MRKAIAAAAVSAALLSAAEARADGHVFHQPAPGPAGVVSEFLVGQSSGRGITKADDPVIPDQQALISFRDGRETLVIETAFTGKGTDFAWVVPTPAVPDIRPSPDHLLSALSYEAQADLISQVPDLRVVALLLAGGLLVARHAGRGRERRWRRGAAAMAAVALVLQLAAGGSAVSDSSVATAGPVGSTLTLPTTPREELVEVRQRATIDGFDTVTLAARDPDALAAWLAGNGYSVPRGLADVAAAYVRDGWVFNAIRLRRDADTQDTNRIRPLVFTFPAEAPVYPMRLTGLTTEPVNVRLFVAGPARAVAEGFTSTRCASLTTDFERESGPGIIAMSRRNAGDLLDGTQVLTRLDRTFRPDEMGADVGVGWAPYAPAQALVYSEHAAHAIGWNLAALVAMASLLALASAEGSRMKRTPVSEERRWMGTTVVLILAVAAGIGTARALPQAETRPVAADAR